MSYLYSPSNGGFYRRELGTPPQDALPVTAKRHADLMAGQARGYRIVPSPRTGRPILQDTRPSDDQRRAGLVLSIKREAARRIVAISPEWRQLNDLREPSAEGTARFARIDAVRSAAHRIEAELAEFAAADLENFAARDHALWPITEDTA